MMALYKFDQSKHVASKCLLPKENISNSLTSSSQVMALGGVTNHLGLPRNVLVLALKVPCPGNPSVPGKLGQLVNQRGTPFPS